MGEKGYTIVTWPLADLLHYYGEEECREHWCPRLIKQFTKQLRKKYRSIDTVSFMVVKPFLEHILLMAFIEVKHEENQEMKSAQYDVHVPNKSNRVQMMSTVHIILILRTCVETKIQPDREK